MLGYVIIGIIGLFMLLVALWCFANYRNYNHAENELSDKLDIMFYDASKVTEEEIREVEFKYNLTAVYDEEDGKLLGFMHNL